MKPNVLNTVIVLGVLFATVWIVSKAWKRGQA
jgi:hypothetical protein